MFNTKLSLKKHFFFQGHVKELEPGKAMENANVMRVMAATHVMNAQLVIMNPFEMNLNYYAVLAMKLAIVPVVLRQVQKVITV